MIKAFELEIDKAIPYQISPRRDGELACFIRPQASTN